MFKGVLLFLAHAFSIRKCPVFRRRDPRQGRPGSFSTGRNIFAKGGKGGIGANGSRGGQGGDAGVVGRGAAIGGRGGDAHR